MIAGREADIVAKEYAIYRAELSDSNVNFIMPPDRSLLPVPEGFDKNEWKSVLRFNSGGVAVIDPKSVLSKTKVEPYQVMPNQAGIAQLVAKGSLVISDRHMEAIEISGDHPGRRSYMPLYYKIVSDIGRFPAELTGAHSVKFLLGKDVKMPKGSPGHSCVQREGALDKGDDGNSNCFNGR